MDTDSWMFSLSGRWSGSNVAENIMNDHIFWARGVNTLLRRALNRDDRFLRPSDVFWQKQNQVLCVCFYLFLGRNPPAPRGILKCWRTRDRMKTNSIRINEKSLCDKTVKPKPKAIFNLIILLLFFSHKAADVAGKFHGTSNCGINARHVRMWFTVWGEHFTKYV